MNSSLRDQLLKAGLVTEKQARQAEQHRRPPPQPKKERGLPTEQDVSAARAQAAKAARDQALNRQQQGQAEKKARTAQIKQLIERNRLPKVEGDESYQFIDGKKIRRVAVNASMRAQLSRGELAIVRYEGHYELVPAALVARIRERGENAVVHQAEQNVSEQTVQHDDPYQDYVIPDDLMW